MAGAAGRGRSASPKEGSLEYGMLLTATMCLLAVGAVMVYSASSARDLLQGGGNGSAFLARYVGYGVFGLLAMHVLRRQGLETVRRAAPVMLAASFGLLLLVMVPGIGVEVNGGRRWLGAGPLQFQPSELMKLSLLLYAVGLIAGRPRQVRSLRGMTNPLLLVAGSAAALVALQPDLGTALVICFSMGALLVAAGAPMRQLALIAGVGVLVVTIFALMEPYRRARLTAFVNPWADAGGAGFQSVQGQIAIGSGGLLGVGLGESVQKVFYLPEAHTDFILAVIGEELGIAGVLGVLFLYGMIAYAGLRTAKLARGAYAKLLATGVTALILSQATLNIFAVLGLAPLTGVPLPFISYGSSNLIVLLGAMGLLLNVASGGNLPLRAVAPERSSGRRSKKDANADSDSRGRDRRARRAGSGGRRRAAG